MRSFVAVNVLIFVSVCGCGSQPKPAITEAPETKKSTEASNAIPPANPPADPPAVSADTRPSETTPQSRHFIFHYKFRVKHLKPTGNALQDLVRVWMPQPKSDEFQNVKRLKGVSPVAIEVHEEQQMANRIAYLQFPMPEKAEFTVDLPYDVQRREVHAARHAEGPFELDDPKRAQLLAATELVPTTGKPLELIKDVKLAEEPLDRARQLYNIVDDHVVYKKEGTGWGRGDTNWVCQSGYGNCTDFHSLFMSLARSQGLPAKFEIGFSIPTDKAAGPIAGYHCWAWFHTAQRGWVPVDISEADQHPEMKEYYFGNLTSDRVTFSVGRDLQLNPPPEAGPLNFFVFPHIEVGGKVLPKENLELQFSFENK